MDSSLSAILRADRIFCLARQLERNLKGAAAARHLAKVIRTLQICGEVPVAPS